MKRSWEVWDTETFVDVQQCMRVCTCVLRVYMCIESVHVCTLHESLYAEVNTWLFIIILLLWCPRPQGLLKLSSICSDRVEVCINDHTLAWLYMTLLDSTTLFHGSTCLYYILPCPYLTLHDSTTFYNDST